MSTVRLQGIGEAGAVPASELRPGMVCRWNYGYESEVLAVTASKSGKTVTVILRSRQSGNVSERRMGAARLVAIA